MKYKSIFGFSFFILTFSACTLKHNFVFRNYKEYYIHERYYYTKKSSYESYQVYLLDSSFRKGQRVYSTTQIYNYKKGDSVIFKFEKNRKKFSPYRSCVCTSASLDLNKRDHSFIDRVKEVVDSLNWPKFSILNDINGFQKAIKKVK